MNYLRAHLDNETLKLICTKIREEILDKVEGFDYTVFKFFKPEDQTTIKRINVNVKDKILTLSRELKFEYIKNNNSYNDPTYGYTSQPWKIPYIYLYFKVNVHMSTGKVTSVSINMGIDGTVQNSECAFSLHVGDLKYLINNEFYDKEGFEEYVFQQSTLDNEHPFSIDYVYEIIQKLKV